MSIVVVSVETNGTTPVTAKAGTTLAGASISIAGTTLAPQLISAAPYTATFQDVPPGDYTAVVQFVDAAGNALGAASSSGQFNVPADISIDVPTVTNVAVQVS